MATAADLLLNTNEEVKPMSKRLHSIVQQRLILLLSRELGLDDVVLPELAVYVQDAEGKNIVPDVVVQGSDAEFKNGILISGADLAVEIMSPKQTFSQLADKCERLLSAGIVPVCWLIWPENRSAFSFSARGIIQELEQLQFSYSPESNRTIGLPLGRLVDNLPAQEA